MSPSSSPATSSSPAASLPSITPSLASSPLESSTSALLATPRSSSRGCQACLYSCALICMNIYRERGSKRFVIIHIYVCERVRRFDSLFQYRQGPLIKEISHNIVYVIYAQTHNHHTNTSDHQRCQTSLVRLTCPTYATNFQQTCPTYTTNQLSQRLP